MSKEEPTTMKKILQGIYDRLNILNENQDMMLEALNKALEAIIVAITDLKKSKVEKPEASFKLKEKPKATTEEENTPINILIGEKIFETEKAYLIKREDGLVAWLPISHVKSIEDDRITILSGHEWAIESGNMEWKKEQKK